MKTFFSTIQSIPFIPPHYFPVHLKINKNKNIKRSESCIKCYITFSGEIKYLKLKLGISLFSLNYLLNVGYTTAPCLLFFDPVIILDGLLWKLPLLSVAKMFSRKV